MHQSGHREIGAWRCAVGDEACVRKPAGDPPGGGLITRSRHQVQRVSARHQRFRRDERGVRDVLLGAVSGTHHDPGGRAPGRDRRRDRVHREAGPIVDALDLDTPALYVDLDVLERNIARMQEQCRAWGVALRPHVKTHKIPEIAQLQLDAGAIGITVAKVGEAEVLPGDDVLVAYPLLKARLPRLRELAKTRRVKVAVDSAQVARDLQGIETLVEIDGRGGPRVGEKVWVVPSHCCATVNLHDEIWYGRRGRVEGSWKVAARGKVR